MTWAIEFCPQFLSQQVGGTLPLAGKRLQGLPRGVLNSYARSHVLPLPQGNPALRLLRGPLFSKNLG